MGPGRPGWGHTRERPDARTRGAAAHRVVGPDARAELRGLVTDAFNTDKEGKINRALIFLLLRRESDDPRWKRGQDAIRDAMRVVGSKTYVRCYQRPAHDASWQNITIDLAKA